MSADRAPDRASLRAATLAGVRWVAAGRACAEVVGLVSTVVLARLVAPAYFGAAAVALIFQALALAIAGQGFGTPLVRMRELRREHLEAAMFASIASGIALSVATFLVAPSLAGLFGERAAELIRLISPVFTLVSISVVPQAVLQREMDFKLSALIEVAALTAGVAASVASAASGLAPQALIIGSLATGTVTTGLLLAFVRTPPPAWHTRELREIGSFGSLATLSSLAYTAQNNVDYAILGARLSASSVGFYWRAYVLAFDYQTKVTRIMQRVVLPVYSRAESDSDVRRLRMRIMRAHTAVLYPLLFMLMVVAPVLIPWLYGARWEPAVAPCQVLAIAALQRPVLAGSGQLLLAAGRPGLLVWINLGSLLTFAAVVLVASSHGLMAVCWGSLGYQVAKGAVVQGVIDRAVNIPRLQIVREVAPALVSGVALAASAAALLALTGAAGLPAPLRLLAAGATGVAAYLLVLRAFFASAWEDVELLARHVLLRRARRVPEVAVRPASSAAA